MLATGNGYDITILLPGYLSKIIEFNGNKLIFNLFILSSILAYRDVITLRNKFIFIDIDTYLFLNSIISFIFQNLLYPRGKFSIALHIPSYLLCDIYYCNSPFPLVLALCRSQEEGSIYVPQCRVYHHVFSS